VSGRQGLHRKSFRCLKEGDSANSETQRTNSLFGDSQSVRIPSPDMKRRCPQFQSETISRLLQAIGTNPSRIILIFSSNKGLDPWQFAAKTILLYTRPPASVVAFWRTARDFPKIPIECAWRTPNCYGGRCFQKQSWDSFARGRRVRSFHSKQERKKQVLM